MKVFYLVIGNDKLFLYTKENDQFAKSYMNGVPYFEYDANKATACMNELLDVLVKEYNLETNAELEFIVLENEDGTRTKVIESALKDYIKTKISLSTVLADMMRKLKKDKKLYIDKLGINYDGKNYMLLDKKVIKSEYSLLAYTVSADSLMKYFSEDNAGALK